MKKLGLLDDSRRTRVGIEPSLKYLIRIYIGPNDIPNYKGIKKSGSVEILKGLVFPQWRRRSIGIVANKLLVLPGNSSLSPEIFDLSSADVFEHSPNYNRLILKIVPKVSCSNSVHQIRENQFQNNAGSINTANLCNSIGSVNSVDRDNVLFMGFEESWERDLWSTWLLEVCFL